MNKRIVIALGNIFPEQMLAVKQAAKAIDDLTHRRFHYPRGGRQAGG